MESALERDDAVALGMAVHRLVFARGLDRALDRLGAGIAEEHDIREAFRAQPLCDTLGFGNLEEIGDVPELLRLLGKRGDEMRVRMPQGVHGDAGGKIEIALTVRGDEPYAFTPLEGEVDTRESSHQMRCHGSEPARCAADIHAVKMKRAASPGGTEHHCISARLTVNTG